MIAPPRRASRSAGGISFFGLERIILSPPVGLGEKAGLSWLASRGRIEGVCDIISPCTSPSPSSSHVPKTCPFLSEGHSRNGISPPFSSGSMGVRERAGVVVDRRGGGHHLLAAFFCLDPIPVILPSPSFPAFASRGSIYSFFKYLNNKNLINVISICILLSYVILDIYLFSIVFPRNRGVFSGNRGGVPWEQGGVPWEQGGCSLGTGGCSLGTPSQQMFGYFYRVNQKTPSRDERA